MANVDVTLCPVAIWKKYKKNAHKLLVSNSLLPTEPRSEHGNLSVHESIHCLDNLQTEIHSFSHVLIISLKTSDIQFTTE